MEVDKSLLMKPEQLQLLVDILLEDSEQYPEDILKAEPHPSVQTLVKFAELIYTKKISGEKDADYGARILSGKVKDLTMAEDGWKLLISVNNTNSSNGYSGAAFVHTGLQQVVVAHRGTDPKCFGALYTDIQGVLRTKYTTCMNSATTFVDFIRQAICSANNQHKHYTLAITGHSLGAWLAQITTFSVKYLAIKHVDIVDSQICLEKKPEVGIHAKTVGFDSPGARDMLDRVLDDYYDRYERNVLLDGLDITLYLSAPNHINTCGVHLGKIYRVFNDISECDDIFTDLIYTDDGTIQYTLATHGISIFIKALINDKSGKIGEVTDWARSSEEFNKLFKILNWDNNYHGHETVNNPDDLKKFSRYKVAENRNVLKSSFRVFSEIELQMLFRMHILQEQKIVLTILNKFIEKNKLKVESTKLLPKFNLNHYNREITCESGESLAELCNRLKQLMRWLKPQFTKAVEKQIKVFNRAADLVYYAEGQSYLDSLPKCWLNFTGSDSFKKFLVSDKEQVLCLVTSSKDVPFQMSRLRNILHQMERSNDSSNSCIKYILKNHYTFVRQSRLQNLIKIFGWPDEKEYMMVLDCTLSSIISIFQLLKDVYINDLKSLKLVLIVSQLIDTPDSSKFNKTVNLNIDVNFSDLTPDSQNIMFNRDDVIITTDKSYSFREFLGEDCSVREISQILCSDSLKNFATIQDYAIIIKDTRPTLNDLQMPFFTLDIKTTKDYIAKCVKSPNTNILVVISGLSREELENGAGWEQLKGMDIILAEGDAQLSFRDTCKKNQDKSIYLFEVFGQDVYCKEIFNKRYYLKRKFLHCAYIDLKMFTKTEFAGDLFVINSEINKKFILELIENGTKRKAFSDNMLTVPTEEEVNVIQKYINKRIHFVKICQSEEGYKLEWQYSHGSVESLLPFMSTDSCEPINETDLSRTRRNMVIIADEPGMGKTTSLARLSRLVDSPWVIYIELKYFQVHINKFPEVLDAQSVARFLLSECHYQADGLLEYLLRSKVNTKRVVLMFDGFDEIDDYIQKKESSKDKIIKLLLFLQDKPAVQTFITTRNYLKESLEESLRQTSTCFIRINAQEQQNYLFVFWSSCLSLELGDYGEEEKGRLKEYAGEVLRQAKEVLGSDMDCFMGIPLQLRMLAEVFRPQSDLLRQSPELLLKQINIVSAPDLYKKFIDLKYEIYLQEKITKCEELHEDKVIKYIDFVTKTHGELAIRTFFPRFYEENFDPIEEEWLNKLNRHGLVQANGDLGFIFVHRTYTEYYCARMVVHWLNQPKSFSRYELFKEILVPQILLHPDSKTIRMFINAQLNEIPMSKKVLELNAKCINQLWLEDSAIFRNHRHQTILHIAVLEKNKHIVTFLLSGLNIESTQKSFVSLITQYDIYYSTVLNKGDEPKLHNTSEGELVLDEIITNILQCIGTCSDKTKETILFASLFNRKVHCDENEETFFFSRLRKRRVLNYFIEAITKEEFTVINSFYQIIIKYLSNTTRIFDRVKEVELEILPFREAIVNNNVEFFREILFTKLKNNIERYCLLLTKFKDYDKQTALHLAVYSGHLDMVKTLSEQTVVPFAVLLVQGDFWNRTALHTAAWRDQLDILKFLVGRGADINRPCGQGNSALMYAASFGELLTTVEYLVESGANINAVSTIGTTALYDAAAKGNLPVVEYLLQQGADPDMVDSHGATALTGASHFRKWDAVRLLLERGVDVNADCGEALTHAILGEEWSIVEALIYKVAAIKESQIRKKLDKFKEKYPNYEFKK